VNRISIIVVLGLCAVLAANCGASPTPTATAEPASTPLAAPTQTAWPTDSLGPTAITDNSVERHYEPAGSFSYVPPAGWELVESSRIPYKIAREPGAGDFAGNLNVIDEVFPGTLDEYVATSLENMSTFFDGYRLISQEEFEPAEGPPGVRVVVENAQQGRLLHQTFYFFGNEPKFVVACTRLAEAGEEFDLVCEQSARTFRIESE
jgi:hypothetical protein